mmetsp:Transcript_6381/g.19154  ORF Transcript_6381/g.19154 Transcript_6381/m.19154 type:complete len:389 (+) Transcript_6381:291-1457(+)
MILELSWPPRVSPLERAHRGPRTHLARRGRRRAAKTRWREARRSARRGALLHRTATNRGWRGHLGRASLRRPAAGGRRAAPRWPPIASHPAAVRRAAHLARTQRAKQPAARRTRAQPLLEMFRVRLRCGGALHAVHLHTVEATQRWQVGEHKLAIVGLAADRRRKAPRSRCHDDRPRTRRCSGERRLLDGGVGADIARNGAALGATAACRIHIVVERTDVAFRIGVFLHQVGESGDKCGRRSAHARVRGVRGRAAAMVWRVQMLLRGHRRPRAVKVKPAPRGRCRRGKGDWRHGHAITNAVVHEAHQVKVKRVVLILLLLVRKRLECAHVILWLVDEIVKKVHHAVTLLLFLALVFVINGSIHVLNFSPRGRYCHRRDGASACRPKWR